MTKCTVNGPPDNVSGMYGSGFVNGEVHIFKAPPDICGGIS